MEGQSRYSHKYLLLQVWCGLLTVAMVVMAAFLTSIKPKSPQHEVSTLKPDPVSPASTILSHHKSEGSAFSYIQLSWDNSSWHDSNKHPLSNLKLEKDSVHCSKDSLYFFYAQVEFSNTHKNMRTKSVIFIRDATYGKTMKKLADASFPNTTVGSVWVAKVVSLRDGDSVSIHIVGDFQIEGTYWSVYQLH